MIYGIAMALIGLFFIGFATLRSDFGVYRLLVARSRLLWGDRVHLFYQVVGALLFALGVLWACGLIWRGT